MRGKISNEVVSRFYSGMQKDYVFGVVEIKKVTAVNSRGVNLPEFC